MFVLERSNLLHVISGSRLPLGLRGQISGQHHLRAESGQRLLFRVETTRDERKALLPMQSDRDFILGSIGVCSVQFAVHCSTLAALRMAWHGINGEFEIK